MLKQENHCVGCKDMGLHCMGDSCPNKSVQVYQCDSEGCGAPACYEIDGFYMCTNCTRDYLREFFEDSTIPELIELFGCTELKPISEEYY